MFTEGELCLKHYVLLLFLIRWPKDHVCDLIGYLGLLYNTELHLIKFMINKLMMIELSWV